jgi:periplasmic divalent cation tolerance protein
MANPYRVALVTAPAGKTSEALARGLVEKKLAACVNIVPGLISHYRWEGKLCRDKESLLVIKTRAALWPKLKRFIEENHPASVPEIISLAITQGSRDYLAWLSDSTRQ